MPEEIQTNRDSGSYGIVGQDTYVSDDDKIHITGRTEASYGEIAKDLITFADSGAVIASNRTPGSYGTYNQFCPVEEVESGAVIVSNRKPGSYGVGGSESNLTETEFGVVVVSNRTDDTYGNVNLSGGGGRTDQ